jgi:hypothetical protein
MNGNEARDMPPSPGSDHTRPGETISLPAGGTKSRLTGTRCSPAVKNSSVTAWDGVGRLGQPWLEAEIGAAPIVSVPASVCFAVPHAPIGRK